MNNTEIEQLHKSFYWQANLLDMASLMVRSCGDMVGLSCMVGGIARAIVFVLPARNGMEGT